MSEADREAWARYTESVAPRRGPRAEPAARPTPERDKTPTAPAVRQAPPPLPPLEVGAASGGLDRATWSRLRSGKLTPVRTLDLHGMTVQRAHAALHAFLAQARTERWRCVEVITGQGSGQGGGAIRREFLHWLNAPAVRPLILAASHPHAANHGSVRLLLRRPR